MLWLCDSATNESPSATTPPCTVNPLNARSGSVAGRLTEADVQLMIPRRRSRRARPRLALRLVSRSLEHGATASAAPCVSVPSGLNVDHHLEVAGVVPQVAVVDAQVEPAVRRGPHVILIADEKDR